MPRCPHIRRVAATALLAGLGLGLGTATAAADAASTLVIKGRGFGHGVGMSQYGAYGYALRGTPYTEILQHYYTGTTLATLQAGSEVGVLMATGRTSVSVTQAARAGAVKLDPAKTYRAIGDGTGGVILEDSGKQIAKAAGPMRLGAGDGPVKLRGPSATGVTDGEYRGAIEVRPSPVGGLAVINAVGLEDYVRGVVAAESPSSWPADALRAQAVAARTYALTTDAGGADDGYTQYADTRSQVYRGVAAETAPTDAAVLATAGQVVTFGGTPITTFFFSTSGGRTENVENSFLGAEPRPYLVSVKDPYDKVSPKHNWTIRLTLRQAAKKLGSLVPGSLKRVTVVKRGVSPRIVSAKIVGSRGTTTISGPALRTKLGLYDTWATFSTVTTRTTRTAHPRAVPVRGEPRGGVALSARRDAARLRGRITPSSPRTRLRVQVGEGSGRWRTILVVHPDAAGRYAATVPGPGVYRVRTRDIVGPSVRVR
ncbi:MAG: SpoIID/LytB protein [Solirubrobacterales bacterium]|nr:SpoIID/LytB protein [Solirubrobacterales bacterium]